MIEKNDQNITGSALGNSTTRDYKLIGLGLELDVLQLKGKENQKIGAAEKRSEE